MARTLADLVATLAADPRHGAVVCDIDGTLAPIAPTPEQATVLPEALPELERLVEQLRAGGLRDRPAGGPGSPHGADRGVAISGNHGLEVMHGRRGDGGRRRRRSTLERDARGAAGGRERRPAARAGLPRSRTRAITFTVHYRGSPRPDHALRYLETQIVPKLDRAGLAWSFGRMVLEVRPPVAIDKGSAVRRLRGRQADHEPAVRRRRPHRPGRVPRGHDQDRRPLGRRGRRS